MTSARAYLPLHALTKLDIESILSIALPVVMNEKAKRRYDYHHSRRTMLYYLLSMKSNDNSERLMQEIVEVRPKFTWSEAEANFNELQMMVEPYKQQYRAEGYDSYWELKRENNRPGPKQSRSYISRYRTAGFQPHELKLYWNYDQISQLSKAEHFNPITDCDTHTALLRSPVSARDHAGSVHFVRSGIQDAVFDVPKGHQVIVLDFADERMPGGYFLENARTQEEVILFNSDGYRGILDLKYQMMNGGYMLPEYGLAYIKNVRFFHEQTGEERQADLIVAACYDLSGAGEGLYQPPSRNDIHEIRLRTELKFQAIIAAAVANTEGDGKNTYLLLGPIGTGAFNNDFRIIAELFSKVLNQRLMNSQGPIRKAFSQIWFVSIDSLNSFEEEFNKHMSSL